LKNSNFFNDLRVNIDKSHKKINKFVVSRKKTKNYSRNYIFNKLNFFFDILMKKFNLFDFLIFNGIKKFWFEEFNDYWLNCQGGRPITINDFFNLYFYYRIISQDNTKLDWSSPRKHLDNWQKPKLISSLFFNIQKDALNPNTAINFRKFIKTKSRVLEYGCSVAPAYRTYRRYFTDLKIKFTLLDIPNISFHFEKWSYLEDKDVEIF